MKEIRLPVPPTTDEPDAQGLIILCREQVCARCRQSKNSGSACLQEIPSGHVLNLDIVSGFRDFDPGTTIRQRQMVVCIRFCEDGLRSVGGGLLRPRTTALRSWAGVISSFQDEDKLCRSLTARCGWLQARTSLCQ